MLQRDLPLEIRKDPEDFQGTKYSENRNKSSRFSLHSLPFQTSPTYYLLIHEN
jgi:hypothetical protein